MELLLLDMDGVLLEPNGYHLALRDTVQRGGAQIGYPNIELTQAQIAQFEALGISNEWHSSAMCMAVLLINQNGHHVHEVTNNKIELDPLFKLLAEEPMENLAIERAERSIAILANGSQFPPDEVTGLIRNSEIIDKSPTMNIFQELILGSSVYAETYKRAGQISTESYLKLHDKVILSPENAATINQMAHSSEHGVSIMTNRPSTGLAGGANSPEAALGAELVGLRDLPLVGFGEMDWLAATLGRPGEKLIKPAWPHALAAVLAASGWSVETSLRLVGQMTQNREGADLRHLQSSRVTVFEDTPGGLIAVDLCADLLREIGIDIEVRKIGIAKEPSKQQALEAQGGMVFLDINQALGNL